MSIGRRCTARRARSKERSARSKERSARPRPPSDEQGAVACHRAEAGAISSDEQRRARSVRTSSGGRDQFGRAVAGAISSDEQRLARSVRRNTATLRVRLVHTTTWCLVVVQCRQAPDAGAPRRLVDRHRVPLRELLQAPPRFGSPPLARSAPGRIRSDQIGSRWAGSSRARGPTRRFLRNSEDFGGPSARLDHWATFCLASGYGFGFASWVHARTGCGSRRRGS